MPSEAPSASQSPRAAGSYHGEATAVGGQLRASVPADAGRGQGAGPPRCAGCRSACSCRKRAAARSN
eukprot:7032968-Lingulodinium_polyedra.AAC.1